MNKLSTTFDNTDLDKHYWTDGKSVFHRGYEIKGADIDTFEHFYGLWAKDKKNCYCGSSKLNNTDPKTFLALNLAYAKDKDNVWTLGGLINDADTKTFEVCDNGMKSMGKSVEWVDKKLYLYNETYVPYGYGKDKKNVYYYNFSGKTKIVKKADIHSFVSLNDGHFGLDKNYVFYGFATILKAKPNTWKKLKQEYYYSKDGNKIFYMNRLIKDADPTSFEVIETALITGNPPQLAKDKTSGFSNSNRISFEELEKEIEYSANHFKKITEKLIE